MTHHHHHHHAGHGHHHHEHASAASIRHERPLWWALALIVLFAGVEAAAAFATNSLALLSDAVHMVTDAFALGVALVAVRLGRRPPDARRSFGYVRAEAMGALLNGLLLFVLSGYILWEAAHRFLAPPAVASLGMLVVGVAGLLVNLVAMRLLHAGSEESLNVKGAYLEVWADMIGSLGVVAGAVVIHFTGWRLADPLIAAAIGLWVLPRAWALVRQAGNVLMMGVPDGIDLEEVHRALAGLPGVDDVHDLHVWALASRQAAMTAHLVVDEEVDAHALRHVAVEMLAARFGIGHATLQVESDPCQGPDCGAAGAGGRA
ncbi:cation diffusion facilitator family transporter [Luteimonas wenzhouensis]|jgi:cobalt-zinc-cadmium efflux system protein|uniref:Cation transporter n=1 Tax=Luteimonas wenzhouensis TaxID=2599615 RepID=A0A5C5TVB6_9GAMM|nr:cation diffusion facilitator family transporter [Luteimonas wenzhouensis]NLW97229.1 cation transporter [Xanthomonadaceae bacterium]TWT17744.1 cation transporter [Luteimonas wenzhouensis]